jgi:hypothetical protein
LYHDYLSQDIHSFAAWASAKQQLHIKGGKLISREREQAPPSIADIHRGARRLVFATGTESWLQNL